MPLPLRGRFVILLALLPSSGACAHASDDAIGAGGGAGVTTASGTGGGASSTTTTTATTSTSGTGGASTTDGATTTTTSATSGGGPGSVFFSEYVEGTGSNKALEIVNTTSSNVALGDCTVDRYQNGSGTAAAPVITLDSVSLGPGQVFVLCNTSFSTTSLCDQLSPDVSHTGNDAVVLTCGGTVKDAFGRVGEDQVWGTAPTTSADATLRRKCSVNTGDTNDGDAFDPATEWDGFAVDSLSNLGQYNCP